MAADVTFWLPRPDPIAIALAILIGLLWFSILAPGWWRTVGTWPAMLVGAGLFPPAIAWVQVPLQTITGSQLIAIFGEQTLLGNLLLASIPQTLESGFVQEVAKLLPLLLYVVLWRPHSASALLRVGVAVGAAYGTIEAAWVYGLVFAQGWTLDALRLGGWQALLPFWERLFTVAFHAASGVLLSYGLARGAAVVWYLSTALLHAVGNYGAALFQAGLMDAASTEAYVALWALLAVAIAVRQTRALRHGRA